MDRNFRPSWTGIIRLQTFTYYLAVTGDLVIPLSGVCCATRKEQYGQAYFGEVNYFNTESQIYHQYQASDMTNEDWDSPIVGCIIEDSQNNLWMDRGEGLNKYNLASRPIRMV